MSKRKYISTPEGIANKAAANRRRDFSNHPWTRPYRRVGKARWQPAEETAKVAP